MDANLEPAQSGDALLVVDMQRDFMPGGSLAVPDAQGLVAPLNRWLRRFAADALPVCASRDWHPPHHASFIAAGGPWPAHCVAGTDGAAFAAGLALPADAFIASKGTRVDADSYSAFGDTALDAELRGLAVRRLCVGGVATEFCVLYTVLDALRLGYAVLLLGDSIAALDEVAGAQALRAMRDAGAALWEPPR
ncbi:peroxyureidoacrylate/ureidoacrylate amidohydrolase RutB [mine drainage metagenome]|jgi:nicotinamidase/pyrazinamidase|uniref:nicotinamidase n=1 Tax=mine drainage metagenome TaxID=410659 RepID=A0A1J5PV27_9ZZZZ